MSIHHSSKWHICLFSLALTLAATTTTTSAFSSRSKRALPKRGSTFATNRRVFRFTLAGGSHTMFSSIRKYSSSSPTTTRKRSQSSSTSLNYRAVDDVWDYCDVADVSNKSSSCTDSLWEDAVRTSTESETMTLLNEDESSAWLVLQPISAPKTKNRHSADGLVEMAKAFIPVAVEIGIVAAAAANVHLN